MDNVSTTSINDEKEDEARHTDPFTTYQKYLLYYINVARKNNEKDIERYILIRYLASEGMSTEEIRKELDKFPLIGCEYLDKKDVDIIYEKIIDRALSYPLVTGINTMIFKNEIDVINSVEDENEE